MYLGRSTSTYVDSPNLGFTYFNFLGGYQLKKTPCMSFVCGAILVGFIGYIYGFIAYNATFIVGTGPTINLGDILFGGNLVRLEKAIASTELWELVCVAIAM